MVKKRKIILILVAFVAIVAFCPQAYATSETSNIALLTRKGFFKKKSSFLSNPCSDVKGVLYQHLKYANNHNIEGLKLLYSPKYVTSDGLGRDVYFKLIKKTWDSYPDIKYKIDIRSLEIDKDRAIAQVSEEAISLTDSKSGIINERGVLQSNSTNLYYFKKTINNEWLITSDYAISEKTSLRYGSAKNIPIDLVAPSSIPAGTQYTSILNMKVPKNALVIASIGQEKITYPQLIAKEVFRNIHGDGVLERVFTSNDDNVNEYAVASFGITKAELNKGSGIKIYVTGVGFIMSRVNVIPKNNFVKALKDEKDK